MLREWERKHPGRLESIFNALGNVEATHLLDRSLHDFAAMRATGVPAATGDSAFDADTYAAGVRTGTMSERPRRRSTKPIKCWRCRAARSPAQR